MKHPPVRRRAERALKGEEDRCDRLLHDSSRAAVAGAAETELIAKHAAALVSGQGAGSAAELLEAAGLSPATGDDTTAGDLAITNGAAVTAVNDTASDGEDLARLVRLLGRVDKGLEPLAALLKETVVSQGMGMIKAAQARATARDAASGDAGGAGTAADKKRRADVRRDAAAEARRDEVALVRGIVSLHDRCRRLEAGPLAPKGGASSSPAAAALFKGAINEAFHVIANQSVGKADFPELLSVYLDHALRSSALTHGGERLEENALMEALHDACLLVQHVEAKDVFGGHHREGLARRLLQALGASISGGGGGEGGGGDADAEAGIEAERNVLVTLRQLQGAQFTTKMEGMVSDVELAREGARRFAEWRTSRLAAAAAGGGRAVDGAPKDFNVTVLTTGHWPDGIVKSDAAGGGVVTGRSDEAAEAKRKRADAFVLAPSMARGVELFHEHYKEISSDKRKLHWLHAMSTCVVAGRFGGKTVELELAPSQASVLAVLEDGGVDSEGASRDLREVSEAWCAAALEPTPRVGPGAAADSLPAGPPPPTVHGNDGPAWIPFPLIVARTALDPRIAKQCIHSLSLARYPILEHWCADPAAPDGGILWPPACGLDPRTGRPNDGKSRPPKAVSDSAWFRVNEKFETPTRGRRRIHVPLPRTRAVEEQRKAVQDVVTAARDFRLQALAVRVMKARKVLSYQALVTEVSVAAGREFPVDVSYIKEVIYELVRKDYLARDADNPQLLNYLP